MNMWGWAVMTLAIYVAGGAVLWAGHKEKEARRLACEARGGILLDYDTCIARETLR